MMASGNVRTAPGSGWVGGTTHPSRQNAGLATLDSSEVWANVGEAQTPGADCQPVNIHTMLLHEIGQTLGLSHSVPGSVMYDTYLPNQQITSLQADDIAGINTMYPGGSSHHGFFEAPGIQGPYSVNALSGPAVTSWRGGNREAFYRGNCGTGSPQLCHRSLGASATTSPELWTPSTAPEKLSNPTGASFKGDPDVISWGFGMVSTVVRGSDDKLYWRNYVRPTWSTWAQIPGGFVTNDSPAAVSRAPGFLEGFARKPTDNNLYHAWTEDYGWNWSGWFEVPGGLAVTSAPSAASWGSGRSHVFLPGTGSGNPLYHSWQSGGSGWYTEYLGGQAGGGPSRPGPVSVTPGRWDLYLQGTDNKFYVKWWGQEGAGT